jgi:Short C-terminal domain
MRQLSPAGEQAVNDLARRHGFSAEAVATMLDAVMSGNGAMAQFSHSEFGGSGQWMRGGMTMLGDMFNNSLKARVDALCFELSGLIASQPGLIQTGSVQSQSQGGQQQSGLAGGTPQSGTGSPVGLFVPAQGSGASGEWWPGELGWPNSTGAQNNVRYAYFAQSRRLAIEVNGTVTVYDTLDHQIGGFSQQQSQGGSVAFSSQHGPVDLGSLPVVSVNGVPPPAATLTPADYTPPPGGLSTGDAARGDVAPGDVSPEEGALPRSAPSAEKVDILATIEKLADLHARGILSEEEFAAKKAQLLDRL